MACRMRRWLGVWVAALGVAACWSASVSAQSAPAPTWRFVSLASELPPSLPEAGVLSSQLGDQGTLLVRHGTSLYVVHDGAARLVVSQGDVLPGGVIADVSLMRGHAASPSRVLLRNQIVFGATTQFLWNDGDLSALPPPDELTLDFLMSDGEGRILARGPVFDTDGSVVGSTFFTTDGISDGPSADFSGCFDELRPSGITPDGGILIVQTVCASTVTRVFWVGGRSGEIDVLDFTSGSFIDFALAGIGGDVLVNRTLPPNFTHTLRLHRSAGGAPAVVASNDAGQPYQTAYWSPFGAAFFGRSAAVSGSGQAIFAANEPGDPLNSYAYYTGPDPQNDRLKVDFLQAFGQDGELTGIDAVIGERMLGTARLADGTVVRVVGYAEAPDAIAWISPAGGSWADAANWSPGQVPSAADTALFNRNQTYTVTVGERVVGAMRVEAGTLDLGAPELDVLGDLSIGGQARLELFEDTVQAVATTVGHLPTATPGFPGEPGVDTAGIFMINPGTSLDVATRLVVGAAGAGEVLVQSGSSLSAAESLIGRQTPGVVQVSGDDTQMLAGALMVGAGARGGLFVLGRAVLDSSAAVIGGGDLVTPVISFVAVDREGLAYEESDPDNWHIRGDLAIAVAQRGELLVEAGGLVKVDGLVQLALVRVPGDQTDAQVTVRGVGAGASMPSVLTIESDLLMGMAPGAGALVVVSSGGFIDVLGNVRIGHEAGSTGVLQVSGVDTSGARSAFRASDILSADPPECLIGAAGLGRLDVTAGAEFFCAFVLVGGGPDSFGVVRIGGSAAGHVATAIMEVMCVGGDPLCGTSPGVAGRLTVEADGRLEGTTLLLGRAGRMGGAGTFAVEETILRGVVEPGTNLGGEADGGDLLPQQQAFATIAPGAGKGQLPPDSGFPTLQREMGDPGADPATSESAGKSLALEQHSLDIGLSATDQGHLAPDPAVLTFQGDVEFGATAELIIDIWGSDISLHDRIVVDGNLQLDGTLVLNFIHYAPRQGDVLSFITATGVVEGAFAEVVVQGLGPGFLYDIEVVEGELRLTALNDASLGITAPVPGPVTPIPTLGHIGVLLLVLWMTLMTGWARRPRSKASSP